MRVGEEDWRSHRDLRLDMLADSPRAFWAQLAEVQDRTPEQWREELRGPRIHLQARCGDQVMGSLAVLPQGYTPEHVIGEDQAILVSLWVRPEARGSGASRALFRAAAELALELGRPHLLLEVDDAGHAARRLYARLGFTETGTRHPSGVHRWRVDRVRGPGRAPAPDLSGRTGHLLGIGAQAGHRVR
ncbi:GNAT family N-acetyltransferase, partial [Brachybacterium sp. p3-SID1565]|uniref:GNAT family N-acetyltransferase n=1 Tax=Brachybacterium sp. p3-SID1565 TaxID=2916046 RepID=UPI0021A7BC71